jgi:hypothetical protein
MERIDAPEIGIEPGRACVAKSGRNADYWAEIGRVCNDHVLLYLIHRIAQNDNYQQVSPLIRRIYNCGGI